MISKEKMNRYVFEQISQGRIEEEIAFHLLKKINNKDAEKNKNIAIIGMACRFAGADSKERYWEALKKGECLIRKYPESRKNDFIGFHKAFNISTDETQFADGGYLDEVDCFDAAFFRISKKEAKQMEPSHRIFLECAWEAMEDAGYGGEQLFGSQTGVFTGIDHTQESLYKYLKSETDPLALTGNVSGILASRIAYIFNLKGPSIVVDTACSSGLVAVHTACTSLLNGECNYAIAGGINLTHSPNLKSEQMNIIQSEDNVVKAFDKNSKGTVWGEGVGTILLKPLENALADGDNIYAIIKGSAINNDGTSNGITAPNPDAQSAVLSKAWDNAGIDPETITYIETHGTGTKLGDPIEIKGLTNAFRRYTNKKQFCRIGTVKPNIGHLVGASGMASFFKAVFALKKGEIPRTINFEEPNPHIDFLNSAVCVNNQHIKWEKNIDPRRAGVSAFGFSGTNCHIVLEEYLSDDSEKKKINGVEKTDILTISAMQKETMMESILKLQKFIDQNSTCNPYNICFTANTGRGHYRYRIAVLFNSLEELKRKLSAILRETPEQLNGINGIYYGENKVMPSIKDAMDSGEITETEKKKLNQYGNDIIERLLKDWNTESMEQLGILYSKGADINWNKLYENQNRLRVSIPASSLKRLRHWIEPQEIKRMENSWDEDLKHPLFDRKIIDFKGQDVYITEFSSSRQWVLKEHKIQGKSAVPGVTYLEMIRYLAQRYYPKGIVELRNVQFFTPLSVEDNEVREAYTVITKKENCLEFMVYSKAQKQEDFGFITHVEGSIHNNNNSIPAKYDIESLRKKCSTKQVLTKEEIKTKEIMSSDKEWEKSHYKVFDWGPRWDNFKKVYIGNDEILVKIELPAAFYDDMKEYVLHPALLDNGANIVPFSIEEGVYLPYAYENIKIYDDMPVKFYCHFSKKKDRKESSETITFDLSFINPNGDVFLTAENYTVKKVDEEALKYGRLINEELKCCETVWIEEVLKRNSRKSFDGLVLIIKTAQEDSDRLTEQLKKISCQPVVAEYGNEYKKESENKFTITGAENEYRKLLDDVAELPSTVIHMSSMIRKNVDSAEELDEIQSQGLLSVFRLTKEMLNKKIQDAEIIIVSNCAEYITGTEELVNPYASSIFGLCRVINKEYSNLKCRCIDIDTFTSEQKIMSGILQYNEVFMTAYRQDICYIQEFREITLSKKAVEQKACCDGGVYLITGGLGGLGLTLADHLALEHKVKLALVSRSNIPPKGEWSKILCKTPNKKLVSQIEKIQKIEKNGSEVVCYSANISDEKQMEFVIKDIRNRFGRICGIIHCAGIAGEGFLIKKNESTFLDVISPKIKGTWLIDKLTRKDKPDFFMLFSSIASFLGGMGQGDYTAGNSFLDSYASFYKNTGKKIQSVNWPAWKEIGMATEYGAMIEDGVFMSLDNKKALKYFNDILNCNLNNVVASQLNYDILKIYEDMIPLQLSNQILKKLSRYRTGWSLAVNKEEQFSQSKVVLKGRDDKDYNEVEHSIGQIWSEILEQNEVDIYENFHDAGGDSILAANLLKAIEKEYKGIISITDIFAYPTVVQMAEYINSKIKHSKHTISQNTVKDTGNSDIAIIGVSCRMPEADNVYEFWDNLTEGRNSIRSFPEERKKNLIKFYGGDEREDITKQAKMGFLDYIDKFDAPFFRISPNEAVMIEPVQRLFLESSWETAEDAGYGGSRLYGTRTGVFAGIAFKPQYSELISKTDILAFTGAMTGAVSSRVAYTLNLKGPSMVIDTACSSGLVAVHEACRAIRDNECTMAVAGGINVFLSPETYSGLNEVESTANELRAFDNNSKGTVWGEGVGTVMLKSLDEALADHDRIYAVIKGSAINNDGASNGLTAPNPEAQTDVLVRAWRNSGINPEEISYIETHGTGTSLGDPIEIKGITDAFKQFTYKKQFCGIGSVKPNIGHTVGASGIASLIKVVLSLKYNRLPATINFTEPNKFIDFNNSPVYLNDMLRDWEKKNKKRIAGVSAFGFTGTNCHIVLEDSPEVDQKNKKGKQKINFLTITAKSKESLNQLVSRHYYFLEQEELVSLEDICYTSAIGRGHYSHRLIIPTVSRTNLIKTLKAVMLSEYKYEEIKGIYYCQHKIAAFGKKIKKQFEITEEEKRELNRQNEKILIQLFEQTENSEKLADKLCTQYVRGGDVAWENWYKDMNIRIVSLPTYPFEPHTYWPEPLKKVVPFGESKTNKCFAMIGNCLVDSLYQSIYQVQLSVNEYWQIKEHKIMGRNIFPGTAYLEMAFEAGKDYFNSELLELQDVIFLKPMLFGESEYKKVHTILKKGSKHIEFVIASNVGEDKVSEEEWIIHAEGKMCKLTKLFPETYVLDKLKERCNIEEITKDFNSDTGVFYFGKRWESLKKVYFGDREEFAELALLREYLDDLKDFKLHPALLDNAVNMTGRYGNDGLYLPISYKGIKIYKPLSGELYSYRKIHDGGNDNNEVKTYDIIIFNREGEILIEIEEYIVKRVRSEDSKLIDLLKEDDYFYKIVWKKAQSDYFNSFKESAAILLLKDGSRLEEPLVSFYKKKGIDVIEVDMTGSDEESFIEILGNIKEKKISKVIQIFSFEESYEIHSEYVADKSLERGFYRLYYLTKELMNQNYNYNLDIILISYCVNWITGEETFINPFGAAIFAMGRVISQEYLNLKCRCIDIIPQTGIEEIAQEISNKGDSYITALRKSGRYVQELREAVVESNPKETEVFKEEGIYIITGGTGGIGIKIAEYMCTKKKIKLALINRTAMPPKDQWDKILLDNSDDNLCSKIKSIKKIEEYGAELLFCCVDVCDKYQLNNFFGKLRNKYGRINGIIHSAGSAGEGFLIRKNKLSMQRVLSSKIIGLNNLDNLTLNDDLDFFVVFSSVISLVGGVGQADYAAANAYMDSFGQYRNFKGRNTLVINWTAWKEIGMAAGLNNLDDHTLFLPVSSEEGVEIFGNLLKTSIENVIVGKINNKMPNIENYELFMKLSTSINGKLYNQGTGNTQNLNIASGYEFKGNIKIKGKAEEDCTEIEVELAKIWADVLGINEIDIYDNFHDLGGDSIQASKFLKEVNEKYYGIVNISNVYTYPSVFQLAEYIGNKIENKQPVQFDENNVDMELDKLLERLEQGDINIENGLEFLSGKARTNDE